MGDPASQYGKNIALTLFLGLNDTKTNSKKFQRSVRIYIEGRKLFLMHFHIFTNMTVDKDTINNYNYSKPKAMNQ